MAGITLQQAEAKLAFWLDLEEQLGITAEITINGKTYKRQQLKDVSAQVAIWNQRVIGLSRSTSGMSVKQVIPV